MMEKRHRLSMLFAFGSFAALLLFAVAPVMARPLPQDQTPYVYPTIEIPTGYPTVILTPYAEPDQPTPTPGSGFTSIPGVSPTVGTPIVVASPTSLLSPSASPTPGRDLFGTEDAEMGAAQLTPPQSETPSSSGTPSMPPSTTPLPRDDALIDFNNAWFTAGLLLPPLILLCAWLIFRARQSGEFG